MKKILILNTTFNKGGASGVARDLFYHFKYNSEFSVFFAYGRGQKKTESNTFKFGNAFESFIHILLVRFLGLEGFGSYFSTRKLINFIEKENFDLIHIHNLHGYYVNFFKLLKYLNKKNIGVVWTLHDEWLFTWLPAHSMNCDHCKNLKGVCTNKYPYPKNYFPIFSNYILRKKKQILEYKNITLISPALWLYKEAVDEFKCQKILYIPNGVDSNIFVPNNNKIQLKEKYSLPPDKKIILFSANNFSDQNKGGAYIPKLAKILESKPYSLCVIGSSSLPQYKNLFGLGYINDKNKLADIYALSDIYCSLSAVETAPLSVLEAMASGLPITGFNIKALNNLTDGGNSKLIPYGQYEELAKVICDILDNEKSAIQIGQRSRDIIIQNFNKESFYKQHEKLYRQ
jgi:glycosyltransferase involved in cell wall biosynthesis